MLRRIGAGRRGLATAATSRLSSPSRTGWHCCQSRRRCRRLRRGRRRHRQPCAARRSAAPTAPWSSRSTCRTARRRPHDHRRDAGSPLAVGRRVVAGDRPSGRRRGRRPPAAVRVDPGDQVAATIARRHHRRGAARRTGPRRLARPAVRARCRRRPALVRRRRDIRAALSHRVDGILHTAVGEGLFDFGHVDGPAAGARMQHPLGVSVASTARCWCSTLTTAPSAAGIGAGLSTVATGLAEPSGGVLVDADLVVVESAAHRLVRVERRTATDVRHAAERTKRPAIAVAPDAVLLRVTFTPPPGRELDDRYGPATQLTVSATPSQLLLPVRAHRPSSTRDLVFDVSSSAGVLHVSAQAASCDEDPAIEHPACYLAARTGAFRSRSLATGRGTSNSFCSAERQRLAGIPAGSVEGDHPSHPHRPATATPARRLRRHPPHRPRGRGPRRRHHLQLGPLLPALRRPRRQALRVLDDARRLGRADQPGRDRRAGHLQQLPQPRAARRHGPHRRPHE